MRQRYRDGVLHCTAAQVKAAAAAWLQNKPASRAAFVGAPDPAPAGLEMTSLVQLAG
jgi:hypothetical protein